MSHHRDLAIKGDCRPPPGDLPSPEIKPVSPASPALQADSLPTKPPCCVGSPCYQRKALTFSNFPCPFSFQGPGQDATSPVVLMSPYALLSRAGSQICPASHDLAGQERQRLSLSFDVPDVFVMVVLGLRVWGKKTTESGTLLVAQWLRLRLPKQGFQVRSPVGNLRSHAPLDRKTKHNTETIL